MNPIESHFPKRDDGGTRVIPVVYIDEFTLDRDSIFVRRLNGIVDRLVVG